MENGWKGDAYHVQDTVTLECVFFFLLKSPLNFHGQQEIQATRTTPEQPPLFFNNVFLQISERD